MRDFAEIWQAADRIVYSETLQTVSTARMRIERDFDPEVVRPMKALAGPDLIVGGPELAAQAFKAGLVDECHLFVAPVVVGGGKRSLPRQAAAIGWAIRALKSVRAFGISLFAVALETHSVRSETAFGSLVVWIPL